MPDSAPQNPAAAVLAGNPPPLVVPFVRTPINIAKEGAYYPPYGLFKRTLKGDVDMQARGAVGSALAAAIAYLALNGYVTGGGPIDPHKRETLEATGWMPYSVKIEIAMYRTAG